MGSIFAGLFALLAVFGLFTIPAKNTMLDALTVDRVGVFNKQADKTGTATASTDLVNFAAHGFAAGDIVVFTVLTGGTGLVINQPYYVLASGLVAGSFKVGLTSGGTAVDILTDYSAVTGARFVEPGAPYARVAIVFSAASGGTRDDSTNGAVVNVPATVAVDAEGGWNNATGRLEVFNKVTQVPGDAANWTYTITDADLIVID